MGLKNKFLSLQLFGIGGQQGNVDTTTSPLPAAEEAYTGTLIPEALQQYQRGSQVAGFSPDSESGFDYIRSGAQQQQNLLPQLTNTVGRALNASDVANNPQLAAAAQAATNPILQNLQESVLPQLRSEMALAGATGGAREGVAQAQSVGRAASQMADATNRLYGNAFLQGQQLEASTAANLPGIMQAYTQPAKGLLSIGEMQRALEQKQLDAPWLNTQRLATILGSIPGSTTNQTSSNEGGPFGVFGDLSNVGAASFLTGNPLNGLAYDAIGRNVDLGGIF